MRGTATMYWRQWSLSAGLSRGQVLSMIRLALSCVSITIRSISASRLATCGCNSSAASTAVWMKLSRKRDLEQSVLHNVGTEALRGNPKLIPPEEHFLEAPDWSA